MMMILECQKALELEVKDGSKLIIQAWVAQIIDVNQLVRISFNFVSATTRIFAQNYTLSQLLISAQYSNYEQIYTYQKVLAPRASFMSRTAQDKLYSFEMRRQTILGSLSMDSIVNVAYLSKEEEDHIFLKWTIKALPLRWNCRLLMKIQFYTTGI